MFLSSEKAPISDPNSQRVNREIANWKRLDHENILQFLGIARVFPLRPPGLVSPYIEVTNILKYIAKKKKLGQSVERQLVCLQSILRWTSCRRSFCFRLLEYATASSICTNTT